ncbi:MAG: hypothetical protein Q8P67_19580, partial [archaeon]|nr:hypothetical protein [archaeon]
VAPHPQECQAVVDDDGPPVVVEESQLQAVVVDDGPPVVVEESQPQAVVVDDDEAPAAPPPPTAAAAAVEPTDRVEERSEPASTVGSAEVEPKTEVEASADVELETPRNPTDLLEDGVEVMLIVKQKIVMAMMIWKHSEQQLLFRAKGGPTVLETIAASEISRIEFGAVHSDLKKLSFAELEPKSEICTLNHSKKKRTSFKACPPTQAAAVEHALSSLLRPNPLSSAPSDPAPSKRHSKSSKSSSRQPSKSSSSKKSSSKK